jgi:hypothetical protein
MMCIRNKGMNDISVIVLNFRDALRALVPFAEKVGVPWRDGESYDEWDGIAEELFQALVIAVVPSPEGVARNFAKYDMRYENYAGLRKIVVRSGTAQALYTFVAFSTRDTPFDSIRVVGRGVNSSQTTTISSVGVEFFVSEG